MIVVSIFVVSFLNFYLVDICGLLLILWLNACIYVFEAWLTQIGRPWLYSWGLLIHVVFARDIYGY